jgi:hypothetical protein
MPLESWEIIRAEARNFELGPLMMKNATVRQILNRIVSQRRNGAWVVQQSPRNMDKDPSYGLGL